MFTTINTLKLKKLECFINYLFYKLIRLKSFVLFNV